MYFRDTKKNLQMPILIYKMCQYVNIPGILKIVLNIFFLEVEIIQIIKMA